MRAPSYLVPSLRARARQLGGAFERALLAREATRRGTADGIFGAAERDLLARLAELIVPAEEGVPGAADVGVIGALERKLAASPVERGRYARGLPAYDRLARRRFGRPFLDLAEAEQVALLEQIDEHGAGGAGIPGVVVRVRRAAAVVVSPASHLFPVLVRDVMEAYYTTPQAWRWLEYDGPPMPAGYLDVLRPRA